VSRALVPGLTSPHPLGERLPAMYLEDSFVQRLTGALDEVIAPIFSSLDNLDSYLDPDLTPEDFLHWLGGWVGMTMDESWPLHRRRAVLAEAVGLYAVRGTAGGLAAHLRLLTGAAVEIEETGGIVYSTTEMPDLPGSPNFAMVVRLRVDDIGALDLARLDALVEAAKPAHVVHRIEVVPPEPPAPTPRPRRPPPAPVPAPPPPPAAPEPIPEPAPPPPPEQPAPEQPRWIVPPPNQY
jgi:phage tail-like protein